MTDRAPPKAKKGAKKDAVKGPKKPKLDPTKLHGIGHNSGQVIPELVNLVDELLASAARQKREGQLQRDLRNRAKTEFGVLSGPLSHEIRLRKMDKDVRVQFESGHGDLKQALGYQPELDFQDGVPTKASAKAQPSEAQMASKDPSPDRYEVEEDEGEGAEEEGEDVPTATKHTQRPKKQAEDQEPSPAKKHVIEREG
jgi:hypothetical protein